MEFTPSQIERAKARYNAHMVIRTIDSYEISAIGYNEAQSRCDYHNNIVMAIRNGNKEVEKREKMAILMEVVREDIAKLASENKKAANLAASADVLAPIKAAKKITAFGQWLNTSGNPYRSQHFSKKYTAEAVNAFMNTL